ncbi:MAG: histidinol-phosphate aminotransferase [Bacillota bacterium]|nr:histidinol-phosphate aminotransferase [Bacillota bacterium]
MGEKEKLFRRGIAEIKPYVPGKPIEDVQREFGLKEVIKLASNENPLGPSPKALAAMHEALESANIYPDGACTELAKKLGAKLGVDPDWLIFANGEDNIITLISKTFLNEGEEMIMADPSFSSFEISARAMGAKVIMVPVRPDFTTDLTAMAAAITERTKLIFLCNPNNPTGTISTRKEVEEFLEKVPEHVIVVLDEAYKEFVDDPEYPDGLDYVRAGRNVIVSRTFSKIYGLAGLRIGYAIAHPDFIGGMKRIREAFAANRVAQAGALAALDDDEFVKKVHDLISAGREYLYKEFERLGLPYVKSQTNFILVDTKQDIRRVFQDLQREGVIIRPGHIWNLPTYARVTVGTPEQNEKFIRALEKVLGL